MPKMRVIPTESILTGQDEAEQPEQLSLTLDTPEPPRVKLDRPDYARTTEDKTRVLCVGCGKPTRQEPVILETDNRMPEDALWRHVIPVYHTECFA